LPHVLLGLTITIVLIGLNYRGIQTSARLGKTTTFTFLTLVIIFALAGQAMVPREFSSIVQPRSAPVRVAGLAGCPWLLSGFESVGKCAEGSSAWVFRPAIFQSRFY